MKKLMFIAILMLSTFASADYLYLGAWSHHFKERPELVEHEYIAPPPGDVCASIEACSIKTVTKREYKETHNLIGYQSHGFMLGYFKNSFDKSSVVIAKQFEYQYKDVALILSAGATHGYTDCRKEESNGDARLCPHIQAGIAYTKFKIEPVLSATDKSVNLSFRIKI
jgi:hypothetical protein